MENTSQVLWILLMGTSLLLVYTLFSGVFYDGCTITHVFWLFLFCFQFKLQCDMDTRNTPRHVSVFYQGWHFFMWLPSYFSFFLLFTWSSVSLEFSLELVFCWFTSPCSCIFFFKRGEGVVKSAKQWLVTLMPWSDVTKKNHVLLELKHEVCFYLKREKAIYALTRFFFWFL